MCKKFLMYVHHEIEFFISSFSVQIPSLFPSLNIIFIFTLGQDNYFHVFLHVIYDYNPIIYRLSIIYSSKCCGEETWKQILFYKWLPENQLFNWEQGGDHVFFCLWKTDFDSEVWGKIILWSVKEEKSILREGYSHIRKKWGYFYIW